MPETYSSGGGILYNPGALVDALNKGGLEAITYGGSATMPSGSEVLLVRLSDNSTYLTVCLNPGWLTLDNDDIPADNSTRTEVTTALNAGGIIAIAYSGDDPDSLYKNSILAVSPTETDYTLLTVTIFAGWPTE